MNVINKDIDMINRWAQIEQNYSMSTQIFIFEFSGTNIIIVLKGVSVVADGGITLVSQVRRNQS